MSQQVKFFYFSVMIVTISCVGDTRKGDKYYKEKSYKKAIIAYSDYLNRHKPTVLVLYH